MAFIYAVDQVTNEFVYGGEEPYDCEPGLSPNQIRVVLPRPVDKRIERYTGNQGDPIRSATVEEIAAFDAIVEAEHAERLYNDDAKATVIWTLTRLLGRKPTAEEKQVAKDEWKDIRKKLN